MSLAVSPVLQSDRIQAVLVVRDDGVDDEITRRRYSTYDEAYDELERFYADLCCSDERIEYSIRVMESSPSQEQIPSDDE